MTCRFLILGSYAPSLRNFRGALIETVRQHGCAVDAVAPDLKEDQATLDWLDHKGATPHDIPLARTGLNPVADLTSLIALKRLFRQCKPDFFLGYTIKPVIWGLLAAWITGVPRRAALITGLGYAFTGKARGHRAIIQRIARALYALALRRATVILFQNEDDRNDFDRLGLLPASVPTTIVNGSGVDTEHFQTVPFPESPVTFLLIARMLGDKGIREYVSAAKALQKDWPEARFQLVGGLDSNPDAIPEHEVRSWHEAGLVTWEGAVSDVRPAIAGSHVYVLPSYREGTPRTVLEAMSMGRPIITTDAPGCRQTVQDGENGLLVPVADDVSLAKAMETFLENPAKISEMGQQSRLIAEEKYDVHKVNDAILTAIGVPPASTSA